MDLNAAGEALEAQRAETLRRLRGLEESFADIVDAAQDSNLDDEHDPEGTTIAASRALVSSLSDADRRQLHDIDAAIARVRDGSYGRCEECGKPIDAGRLEARPTATRCIECARAAGKPRR
ncbi:TraR/DksA family transcriptional regulator [Flexivirga lutea]